MQAATDRVTYEEYLKLDAESEVPYEFYYGRLICMAGEQPEHLLIRANLHDAAVRQQPEGCRYFGEGARVSAPGYGSGSYAYPDAFMTCGEQAWDRSVNPPILLNPRLVVEVTSGSTADLDLGPKVEAYLRNEHLAEYWVVAASRVLVVRHMRLEDGRPLRHIYTDLDEALASEALGLSVPLRTIYAGVIDG